MGESGTILILVSIWSIAFLWIGFGNLFRKDNKREKLLSIGCITIGLVLMYFAYILFKYN